MPIDDVLVQAASERIRESEKILIASHIRPDGDAVGSLIGFGLALEQAGHAVQMVIDDGIPASLRYLEGSERILRRPSGDVDLFITVDCSELERCGTLAVGQTAPGINIDHHITNPLFADINLVDEEASATSEILAFAIPQFGLQLSSAVAAALLTGLITDTIGFRTSNVRSSTLKAAAMLLDFGVDMAELYKKALISRSFESVKLWGKGLDKLEKSGRLIWTSLTIEDRQQAGYSGRDDADLINLLSSIEGADVSVIFVEQPNGNTKISWRSQPGFDVARLASEFGGGGHPAASGAELTGSLAEVQKIILEKTYDVINGGNRV